MFSRLYLYPSIYFILPSLSLFFSVVLFLIFISFDNTGRALLFLLPEETAFLKYLREAKVTLQEYEFPVNKVANIGTQTMMLVEKNYYLNKSARDAYRSYLLSYASHSHKDIFNVHELDLQGTLRTNHILFFLKFFIFLFLFSILSLYYFLFINKLDSLFFLFYFFRCR